MNDFAPHAEIEGVAWWPTLKEAYAWAISIHNVYPDAYVREMFDGFSVESSPFSGAYLSANLQEVEL